MNTDSELSDSSSDSDSGSDSSAAQSTGRPSKSNDKKLLLKKYGFAQRNASLDPETLQPVLRLLIENGNF